MTRKTLSAGGAGYGSPFVDGPRDVEQILVDVSDLSYNSGNGEVDTYGYLKPGVPLNAAGDPITTIEGGVTVTHVAGGSAGDFTLTGITTEDELLSVEAEDTTSGVTTNLTAQFTITAANTINNTGGTASTGKVLIVRWRDASAAQYVYGVVIAPVYVGATGIVADAGLDSLADFPCAVARGGLVNRDVVEDNLGRALTAAELAAFMAPGCNLRLTAT